MRWQPYRLIKHNFENPMKRQLRHRRLSLPSQCLLFASVSLSIAHAQLLWDPNGVTTPDPSDGIGNWNGTDVWYNSTANTHAGWVAGSQAVFGAGGNAGIVNLQGGNYSVSGLQFNAVSLGSTSSNDTIVAYRLNNGTLTLVDNGIIDIRTGSSSSQTDDRIRFENVLAGNNISISSTSMGSGTSFVRLDGANTWTGNLSLTGSAGGQFIEVMKVAAISNLAKITGSAGTTLALAVTNGNFSGPEISIQGTGSSSRGALRIDASSSVANRITLAADAQIGTGSVNVIASLTGNISGNFRLDQNAGGTTAVGTIIYAGSNTVRELLVTKGNAQIGFSSFGITTGTVTVNGATAFVTGTGTINGALNVTTGMVKPGDRGATTGAAGAGENIGTLNVIGDTTFNPTDRAVMAEFQMGSIFSDKLSINGALTLNGQTDIVSLFTLGYVPKAGDSWNLITYGGLLTENGFDVGTNLRTGADTDANEGNLNLPDISSSGLLWNVTLGGGSLTAELVPEPSAALLFGSAATILSLRRRRKSGNGQ